MLMVLIDAAVLIALIKVVTDEDMTFGTAALIGFVASISTTLLALGLVEGLGLGLYGLVLTAVFVALSLGIALSAMFGVDVKRAVGIGIGFIVIHIAVVSALQAMLR